MTPPLTSIVILTRNELAYTVRCVDSIKRHTPEPHELVFVDNASNDGTLEYLHGIDGALVIDNDANLGFGGGCNQGIAAARGERILLLNNDVVVTPGWLQALHRALDADPRTGIVGPRSNRVAGDQQVDDVGYDEQTLDGLETWAHDWCTRHAGLTSETPRVVGFCLLMERAVVARIGGFDLRFGIGNFEDDDFCLRAAVAGLGSRIVHDSWVHHFGSRTFVAEGVDYTATITENLHRFAQAWDMVGDDIDMQTGSYAAERIVQRTTFDPSRHYAPLVATPDDHARVELDGRRTSVVAVACERVDPVATRAMLAHALGTVGPDDDITVVIRIDPRDAASVQLLDAVADEIGDSALPDVIVVHARDEHDGALLRAADMLVVSGRFARARSAHARRSGVVPVVAGGSPSRDCSDSSAL